MSKKWQVILVLLATLATLTITGKAYGQEPQRPTAPQAQHNCGYIWLGGSCTIYFNQSETQRLADGDVASATLAATCTTLSWIAGIACAIASAGVVIGAQAARSLGKCYKLKYGVGGQGVWVRHGSFACSDRF